MDMRQYDHAIGRWTSIDPITHHDMSPYVAFNNNPIFYLDPSGAEGEPITEKTEIISSSVAKDNSTIITQTTVKTTTTTGKNGSITMNYSISSVSNTVDAYGNVTKGENARELSGSITKDSEGNISTKIGDTKSTQITNDTTNLNKWASHVSSYNKSNEGIYNKDMINKTSEETTIAFRIGIGALSIFSGGDKVISNFLEKNLPKDGKNIISKLGVPVSIDSAISKAGEFLKNSIGENNNYMIIYGVQHIHNGTLMKAIKTPDGSGASERKSVGPTSFQDLWKGISNWFD